jgi:2-methylcitrate dehydratase PrpD
VSASQSVSATQPGSAVQSGTARDATAVLAEYVAGTRTENLPADVLQRAAVCAVDALGSGVAGSRTDLGAAVSRYAIARGKSGAATVIGGEHALVAESATLANSTMCHVLELDDGHRPSDNHLGCVVVPAALALAEELGSSGADFARAVVLGYDVMGRVGEAVCLPRRPRPIFHHTSTTAGLGAAAVAGALLGLSASQLADAFGIALTGASGLREVFVSGTDCKPLQVGRSASLGIAAALMAAEGVHGPAGALDGEFGFINAMGGSQPRPELMTAALGTRYTVMESTFKIHAVCGALFTAIDASLYLRHEHAIQPDEIRSIDVAMPAWVAGDSIFARRRPRTPGIARFSIPYAVAAAFSAGAVGPAQISADGIASAEIAGLESRIALRYDDPEVEEQYQRALGDSYFFHPAAVTVRTEGASFRRFEKTPVGYDPRRALSTDVVVGKFVGNVGSLLPESEATGLADAILRLPRSTEPVTIGRALSGRAGRGN